MLYNRLAVKNKRKLTDKPSIFYRRSPLFHIDKKTFESIREKMKIPKRSSVLERVIRITGILRSSVEHRYHNGKNHYQGIKPAIVVLADRKGHCIEKNILLNALLTREGIPTKWLVTKNPKGYENDIDSWGVHPFLIFKYKKKEYVADGVTGMVGSLESVSSIAEQRMSYREFCAFCHQDAGEDLAFNHKNFKQAFKYFNIALSNDPNHYPVYVSMGDTYSFMEKPRKAEWCYKEAIDIAPDIVDTHKFYGDFLWDWSRLDKARQEYLAASEMPTKDFQVLYSLERRLWALGKRSVSRTVQERRKKMQKERGFDDKDLK